jgi:hypothetical protein
VLLSCAQAHADSTLVIVPVPPDPTPTPHISYSVADLPDVNPGQNLYRYDYSLDAFPYPANHGFQVLFDPALYASLQLAPPAVGADWVISSAQPVPRLLLLDPPAVNGSYAAEALVAEPSPLTGFSIDFVWLGTGAPGSQPFDIFIAYHGEYVTNYNQVESGRTTAVPEPASAALLAIGMFGLALRAPLRKRAASDRSHRDPTGELGISVRSATDRG